MSQKMRKSESTKSHFSPAMSWKTRLTLYMGSAITDAAQRPDGTLNRRLLNVLDLKAHPTPHSLHHVRTNDVAIDPSRNLWFRIFTPTNNGASSSSLPLFVFFHGGGFAYLSPASKSYDAVCRRIARRVPAVIASVNYRLSPEYRFPCQYSDGFDALKFLDTNTYALDGHNADPTRCFLAGDSAGANLAHHVAVSACKAELRRVRIVGLVSIQPFLGGEERTEAEMRLIGAPLVSMKRTDWLWRVFLPEGADRDHGAVNVSGPNAEDISGLDFPETVVFVGGFDPLQDWQRRYGEWLRKSGKKADIIEYPNMIHAFYVFPELPEASQLIDQVRDFVNIRLSSL